MIITMITLIIRINFIRITIAIIITLIIIITLYINLPSSFKCY